PMPPPDHDATSPAARNPDNDPTPLRHPMEHLPPRDGAPDACVAHCRDPIVPPWVQRSYVPPATTDQCSSSSEERYDQRAPRLLPGPRYMPQSVVLVGLA